MKLTKQSFVEGLDLDKVEMSDLRAFAVEHGLAVDKIFIQGRKKNKVANMIADWVEQEVEAEMLNEDIEQDEKNRNEALIEEPPAPQTFSKPKVRNEGKEKEVVGNTAQGTAEDGTPSGHPPQPVGKAAETVAGSPPDGSRGATPNQPMMPAPVQQQQPVQQNQEQPMTAIREVPMEERRENGRNEVPIETNDGSEDAGSNYMNRRQAQIGAMKGRFARQTEMANAEAEETTWHKRRAGKLRSHRKVR